MTTSATTSSPTTTFDASIDRIGALTLVAGSALVLASTVTVYLLGAAGVGGALGIVGAGLLAAAAPAITRPLQATMPRVAAALTMVFAYGFVVGGVAFNLETVLAAQGVPPLSTLGVFPVLGASGVLGPLALAAIGVSLVVSGTARGAGIALTLTGVLFPVSRIGDVAAVAVAVDSLLFLGMTVLARGLAAAPRPASAERRLVPA